MSTIWALMLSNPAAAFCGTFVGGVGTEFFNEYSQAALVRSEQTTTLTVRNDVQGEFSSFALVMPVPEVLAQDAINVIDPQVFDNIDAYSGPRLVRYICEDFEPAADTGWDFDNSTDPSEPNVSVEAQYIVGEYEIVILSATESDSLFEWLGDNGYQIPGQSVILLQEYIEAGQFFLAAKVSEAAGVESGDVLSPLQLTYQTGAFALPIRIGTLNSKDEQDLVLYVLNDYALGAAGISNYSEFFVEDECMWETQGEAFGTFYADQFRQGYEAQNEGSYLTEYAWGGGGCDPCPGDPPSGDDLISLGVDEERIHTSDYFLTRLHMRYTPAQATEDITLYHTNITETSQIRYIEYLYELEDRFEVCGEGMVDDPGSCDSENNPGDDLGTPDAEPSSEAPSNGQPDPRIESGACGGCSTGQGSFAFMSTAFALILGIRRRRSL